MDTVQTSSDTQTSVMINNDTDSLNDALFVTDSAAMKVYELIQEEGNMELKLRVFVTGGGCSGFQYGFSFEEKANEDDFTITKSFADKKVQLVIDALSY